MTDVSECNDTYVALGGGLLSVGADMMGDLWELQLQLKLELAPLEGGLERELEICRVANEVEQNRGYRVILD